jgi:two-component system, OmpR family, KDP operon response regulator KdpE
MTSGEQPPARPRPHVLVVHDEAGVRDLLHVLLGSEGYVVHTADSGGAALGFMLAGLKPSAVVLDMQMQRMDGASFLAQLRQLPGGAIPVVAMSSQDGGPDAARRHGVDAVIAKSRNLDALFKDVLAAVETVLPR